MIAVKIFARIFQDSRGSDEDFTRMIIKDPLHDLVRTLIILVIMVSSLTKYCQEDPHEILKDPCESFKDFLQGQLPLPGANNEAINYCFITPAILLHYTGFTFFVTCKYNSIQPNA